MNHPPLIKKFLAFFCLLFALNSFSQYTTYTTPGTTTITTPIGVTKATIEAWGGGGKGGTRTSNGVAGGGGGGEYTISTLTSLLGDYDIVVGAGSATTGAGGNSEFNVSGGSVLASAIGGNSVADDTTSGATGGTGGINNGGTTTGSNGADGAGTSGGDGGAGGNGGTGGGGGFNIWLFPIDGEIGSFPGGGGGGGFQTVVDFFGPNTVNAEPGNGGNGQVIVCLWPADPGTITGTSTICQGDTGVAFSIPAISNATSYEWSYGGSGVTINGTGNSVTLDFASNATSEGLIVRGINECGEGVSSAIYPITVHTPPTSGFSYADTYLDVSFTNTSTGGTTSLWDFGDGNTSTDTNPSHSFSIAGDYNVTLTTTGSNGCTDEITQLVSVADDPLGIDDEILSAFNLYPNPVTSGEIKITLPNEIDEFNVTISSILGQQLVQNKLKNRYNSVHTVDVTNYKAGIYFITVSTENGNATKKLIIN